MKNLAFLDLETDMQSRILDIGCIRSDSATFHRNTPNELLSFLQSSQYLCGHNIIAHDIPALIKVLGPTAFFSFQIIDTLYWSPLLFPKRPYHRLVKDDKIQSESKNNPVNDALQARDLFWEEVQAFQSLEPALQQILFGLLKDQPAFTGFFHYLAVQFSPINLTDLIQSHFQNEICQSAPLQALIEESPIELAYALMLVRASDRYSITPPWVLNRFPAVGTVLFLLRGKPCLAGCTYCNEAINPLKGLKRFFGFDGFRKYGEEDLQAQAVQAALNQDSLLAVFPTGGGKSITFQLPALMAGEQTRSLTVVISPLLSLMKDQVDNLERKGITDAVTINGLLDPIERSKAIERLEEGSAHILYIAPESLRSNTVERLLLKRPIARFVIDEAHCFSSWGQDFRVDYLYIGDFIKSLQEKKQLADPIPVSCFTATAKQKVIEDIRTYFKEKLNLHLSLFTARASRTNLHYKVFQEEGDNQKYEEVRRLLQQDQRPTIIYVSRTRKAMQLAEKLTKDGFEARAFHGKMTKEEKTENQEAFMAGRVNIMVATSAFGMGVDKSDVGRVIHFEISDSLENYVQEAGRAGRDENITADCYILFNESDLDSHFILLNQTKLDKKEINQIWRAIKDLTKTRNRISQSALEIARKAGWDENVREIETRVLTAIAALEDAGYVKRGQNMPQVFADSILCKSAQEAIGIIQKSDLFQAHQKEKAIRIIKKLFSSKSKRLTTEEDAESRVDYLSDTLGIPRGEVIQLVQHMREAQILADAKDITAFVRKSEKAGQSLKRVKQYAQLEQFLHDRLEESETTYHLKEIHQQYTEQGHEEVGPTALKTLINFWSIKQWVKRQHADFSRHHVALMPLVSKLEWKEKMQQRQALAIELVDYLYGQAALQSNKEADEVLIEFSVKELQEVMEKRGGLYAGKKPSADEVEEALFFLSRIQAIKIEGGFMVVYHRLTIDKIETNNAKQYTTEDYKKLDTHYKQKIQQIHIVGEYAKKMLVSNREALQFVDDYFRLSFSQFLQKYFPGRSRQEEIGRSLTPAKFRQLFGALSPAQLEIIRDGSTPNIVVAAGPGSGKTRVLVHKLASLLMTEDIKHEQMLMLTFSRAAATEFKMRLIDLIGNAAVFIEIKTFHSYCFDLLGAMGTLSQSEAVIRTTVEKIQLEEVEMSRITKSVLVIDEAQDMNADELSMVSVLMQKNPDMRVLLVGDDDQNIYGFRGSDSKYMQQFIEKQQAKKYELVNNYRSKSNLVAFANQWAKKMKDRLKEMPIQPVDEGNGKIEIVEYKQKGFMLPMVESILQGRFAGSTCVLTRTNEEALRIKGLLVHLGIPAQLVQTNEGFGLAQLQELRFFTECLMKDKDGPLISEENWEAARRSFKDAFQASRQYEPCLHLIEDFRAIHPKLMYKSDWKHFLQESKYEDFLRVSQEMIYVSTIHKSKGKEFENVILYLDEFEVDSEEAKRQLYVAITRAKQSLIIHYNRTYLVDIITDELLYTRDNGAYPEPEVLTIGLTLKNVQLGYFEYVQGRIKGLVSGMALRMEEEGLAGPKGLVLKYSNAFKERLKNLDAKGWKPERAMVNYLVYWTDKDKDMESLVVLPELTLRLVKVVSEPEIE
jgi:ATP-dependent DNA helicase RecQ